MSRAVVSAQIPFDSAFEALVGFTPMGWQRRLFERFVSDELPTVSVCDIPTGVGKTSVMAIWLVAVARQAALGSVKLPRRLVYVVNRRTVVDQATDDALAIHAAISDASGKAAEVRSVLGGLCVEPEDPASPLAVSTLRGELADNREWQADPSRPAIIVGTVDMIGSRLLFSGYRAGWKSRAFDAGLLGQDALLIHDEAHLTPAFGKLVRAIAGAQAAVPEPRPLRVLELSATVRSDSGTDTFRLTEAERREPLVQSRIEAAKALHLEDVADERDLSSRLAEAALAHREERARIIVYVRSPEHAKETRDHLQRELKDSGRLKLLTGTLRGHERDLLVRSEVFKALKADPRRSPIDRSLFLVSTSAGEVGANLDADHLVCDLSTLDSMVQRFGRVNRLGRDDSSFSARIDVLATPGIEKRGKGKAADDPDRASRETARHATRAALGRLQRREDGGFHASPSALGEILDDATIEAAFAPPPRILPCTDILLDAWALTSIREVLPGRPRVEPWLHGVESELPETTLVWRAETIDLAAHLGFGAPDRRHARRVRLDVEEWLDSHRIVPSERLRESTRRIKEQLGRLASRLADESLGIGVVVLPAIGAPFACSIADLAAKDGEEFAGATVLLPPSAGGLDTEGMLDGRAVFSVGHPPEVDVADLAQERARLRVQWARDDDIWRVTVLGSRSDDLPALFAPGMFDSESGLEAMVVKALTTLNEARAPTEAMTERGRLVFASNEESVLAVVSFGRAGKAETALAVSAAAQQKQTLDDHLLWAGNAGATVGRLLALPDNLGRAVEIGARWHDRGKSREIWQRAIFNPPPREPLAKTTHGRFNLKLCAGYRHEFGSLVDALPDPELSREVERDLLLHLIAAHHARARPHFQTDAWDRDEKDEHNQVVAEEVVRRYVRLQRRFGRWGLAWLEALMKCADVIATVRGDSLR